jgi:hypothetical protein
MTEEQLSALLRLKRHEQPPPGYFDHLLQDVHRRQREELLQRSLWSIAFERWQTFFSAHSMGSLSYATALAGALVAGVSVATLLTSTPRSSDSTALAQIPAAALPTPSFSLQPAQPRPDRALASAQPPLNFQAASRPQANGVPRYVIDARPVSYEPSFSF